MDTKASTSKTQQFIMYSPYNISLIILDKDAETHIQCMFHFDRGTELIS